MHENDVIVVGGGFSGLYALIHLRSLGLRVTLLEAGGNVGGTWYWNRYPNARVDVESVDYSYSFSPELQQEWSWSERFAGQGEILSYLQFVADRFDLWPSIALNTRVASATFAEGTGTWELATESGERYRARYCVMATGFLSAPLPTRIAGLSDYRGLQIRSTEWPDSGLDLSGLSVGLIGTGSTGVQLLPYLAREARSTTVFQRTPAYAVPLRNAPQSPEFEAAVKSDYARWRAHQRLSPVGAIAVGSARAENDYARSALDVSDAERQELFDRCWERGGIIGFYLACGDLLADERANKYLADYLRDKIRERVADPRTADLLLPDYPVMSKRLCADTGYFEAFNNPQVRLVDVRNTELVFERDGVRVGNTVIELDAVVLATGFDAITGALRRIHVVGRGRRELRDHWATQIRTALGIMSAGFPNLFWINGPGSSAADASPPLMAEDQVTVIARLITTAEESGEPIEASRAMEDAWLDECTSTFEATLLPRTMSWYNGGNVPGKVSEGMLYLGGPVAYVEALEKFAETLVASIDPIVRGDRD